MRRCRLRAASTTFVVNRNGDAPDNNLADTKCDTSSASGKQCTLRAAIQEANDTAGPDLINFNITSASKVIAPASPLPAITETVNLNGNSQPGASQNTLTTGDNAVLKIVLDGIGAGAGANGLEIQASGATIGGLAIQRFDGSGVSISGSNNSIYGNFIGTNAAGTLARGNGTGVTVTGSNNYIGIYKTYTRNIISGNELYGVLVTGASANDNRVQGNYIGTRKTGTVALGNGADGVRIEEATSTQVGLAAANFGNLISGNGGHGVRVFKESGTGASNTLIQGNLIGTDATGTADLGNALSGVFTDALSVQIGGNTAAARNVVSGNGTTGITVENSDTNVIQGNYIGTKADATGDLGNGGDGIFLDGNADDNTIGGTTSGTGNVISGNGSDGINLSAGLNNLVQGNVIRLNGLHGVAVGGEFHHTISGNLIFSNGADGIEVSGASTVGVRISANQIFANGGLGIDLVGGTEDAFGVSANDPDDPDTGANNLQNFPVLTTATRSNANGVTIVTGTLNSNPSTDFKIELFLAVADSSGHGEAQVLLASKTITTDAGGDKSFSIAVAGLSVGLVLTATVTSTATFAGNTSEFSLNRTVVAGP